MIPPKMRKTLRYIIILLLLSTFSDLSASDIVVADSGQNLGDGRTFSLALGDLDGDEDLDLFVANYVSANKVWFNDSSGTFTDSGQGLAPVDGNGHVALEDLDGDLDLDAFVTNSLHGSKVFLNNGSGLFSDSGQSLGLRGQKLCLADLDCDGDADAITTHMQDGNPIWLNDGNGTFTYAGQDLNGVDVIAVAAGDVDADNDLDVLIGKVDGGVGNRLYINQTIVPVQSTSWGSLKALYHGK